MFTRASVAVLLIGALTLAPAAQPEKPAIAPRTVTLNRTDGTLAQASADVAKQTGLPLAVDPRLAPAKVTVNFTGVPVWASLEDLARQTDTRIVLHDGGNRIALEPRGKGRDVSSVSGPFRTVVRQVTARFDLAAGESFYDVQLDAHWEPRIPVFRISSVPEVTNASDDRGTVLTPSLVKANAQPTGSAHTLDGVRLAGLTRASRTISLLSGTYTVTAAEKMLAFRFNDLTGKPPLTLPAQDGVTATLRRFAREEGETVWEAEVEVNYPAGLPHFESFEEGAWLTRNRMHLVPPGGGKAFSPDSHQVLEAGRRVIAVYRFKEDAGKGLVNPAGKGWALVYDTPAQLVEFAVRFELKDIPLP